MQVRPQSAKEHIQRTEDEQDQEAKACSYGSGKVLITSIPEEPEFAYTEDKDHM
ncbi:uncharacterized protein APUU_41514S [Aspergillus puulaauensis]|uniref:Uncharacterized protein n=1 Tax=Aspergillus puulaauensis TaxID=1220207 RepID=A0A7R7XP06_9EURO|nr:uncharacterized protein APUU_41514S [Aspergillus puulaauensis]BCS25070.1 hypothetical protein APUU_41514S [Aspergillus puulaauensis]